MNDKEIMTNLLNSVKGECDLLMHGTIESSTPNVHSAFKQSLDDALMMQSKIYARMSEKGWYPMQQAQGVQIDAVKQKFASQQG